MRLIQTIDAERARVKNEIKRLETKLALLNREREQTVTIILEVE